MSNRKKQKKSNRLFVLAVIAIAFTTVFVLGIVFSGGTPQVKATATSTKAVTRRTTPRPAEAWTPVPKGTMPPAVQVLSTAVSTCPPTKDNLTGLQLDLQPWLTGIHQVASETDLIIFQLAPDSVQLAVTRFPLRSALPSGLQVFSLEDNTLYAMPLQVLVTQPVKIVSGVLFVGRCGGKTYLDSSHVGWKGEIHP